MREVTVLWASAYKTTSQRYGKGTESPAHELCFLPRSLLFRPTASVYLVGEQRSILSAGQRSETTLHIDTQDQTQIKAGSADLRWFFAVWMSSRG